MCHVSRCKKTCSETTLSCIRIVYYFDPNNFYLTLFIMIYTYIFKRLSIEIGHNVCSLLEKESFYNQFFLLNLWNTLFSRFYAQNVYCLITAFATTTFLLRIFLLLYCPHFLLCHVGSHKKMGVKFLFCVAVHPQKRHFFKILNIQLKSNSLAIIL